DPRREVHWVGVHRKPDTSHASDQKDGRGKSRCRHSQRPWRLNVRTQVHRPGWHRKLLAGRFRFYLARPRGEPKGRRALREQRAGAAQPQWLLVSGRILEQRARAPAEHDREVPAVEIRDCSNFKWRVEMTEDQIERTVERKFNSLDAKFMAGAMTQAEYDLAASEINKWADKEYEIADAETELNGIRSLADKISVRRRVPCW